MLHLDKDTFPAFFCLCTINRPGVDVFTQPITTAIPFLFASYADDSGNSIATAVLSIDRVSADDLQSEFTCFGKGPYHVKKRTVTLKQRGQRWVTVVL